MKPIAVLGTGPAGLMAAHGVAVSGRPFALFTAPDEDGKPKRSEIGGAQFIHSPIPGIHLNGYPEATITYRKEGTADGYEAKLYSPEDHVPFVSFSNVQDGQLQDAWNLGSAYDKLWDLVSADRANLADIDCRWLDELIANETFDAIISTIPAPALCRRTEGHMFPFQSIKTVPYCALESLPDHTVFYSGLEDRSWYRCSRLFGHGSTEWKGETNPMLAEDVEVTVLNKPISTDCDCFPDVIRLGRMGRWTKGVLSHEGFYGAIDAMHKL